MTWRLRMFGRRLLHFVLNWPKRVVRLCLWTLWIRSPRGKHSVYRWLSGLILLILDLAPLGLLYETVLDFVKPSTRALSPEEIIIAHSVFGSCIPLHLISLDPESFPVKRKRAGAYVSFHTINFFRSIPPQILIHELVHIWQFKRYGSVYISEAIWAQHWGGGYDYGGLEPLMHYSQGKGLSAFNFEQQADIIEDYYRWKNGLPLQWALNVPGVGEVLETYRNELA